MRHHYMTLCYRNNIEVTHKINPQGRLEITFEEAVKGGFKTLVFLDNGNIVENDGFNSAEVGYFKDF